MSRTSLDTSEKPKGEIYVENATGDTDAVPAYDAAETGRILRKIDWRLLPLLTLLFVISFVDRSNMGNAKVAGMNDEINLTPSHYNIALTVFFFPYALLEVPSNMLLKIVRPSMVISAMMVMWGTVMTLMSLVKSYNGLAGARVALGAAEAGFFPAATYLLTVWYLRLELQRRMALFYSAASLSGAFSGLLAFALQKMDGIGGLSGWRWIFLLEGLATVTVGVAVLFLLPDKPATASFLKPEERRFLVWRLARDTGTNTGRVQLEDKFNWQSMRSVLLDWKIWAGVLIYWGNTIAIYGFNYTAPSVIQQLGYSSAKAQLLTIPVYGLGAIVTPIIGYYADKYETRWPFIVGPYCLSAVGFIGLLATPQKKLPGLTYAWLFCVPAGVFPPLIGLVSWIGNNLAPSWNRAIGMALLISMGNLGGAIGSNVYLDSERPRYWTGYGVGPGVSVLAILSTFVLKWEYTRLNHAKEAMGTEEEIRAKYSADDLIRMGDKSPLYRYIV